MSGQWEVVGKKKDKNGKQPIQKSGNNKENKPKIVVKVEDVLPQAQIKNLFGGQSTKETQKTQEKHKKAEVVNQQKKQKKPHLLTEKQEVQPKPKPPKSIESALKSINIDELKKVYEDNKSLYPDAPIICLKELAQFLSQRLSVDISDPVFQNKSECYPLSTVPTQIKNIMERAANEAGNENAQLFFHICLSTMVTDMTKGLPALGHKLFIQLLALNNPKIVISNLQKSIGLRTSYQNRQNIGLSILWALGVGGLKDLNVGFKVFQEIMFPLVEMKNYTRYVCGYLIDLINRFNDVPLSKEQYQFIMEFIYSNKKSLPHDLTLNLQSQKQKMKELLFINSKDKYHCIVEFFLKRITLRESDMYRAELCDVIITCLTRDPTTFATWSKLYTKNLPATAILLNYINDNWSSLRRKFSRKVLNDMLTTYSLTNDELLTKKKREDGLLDAIDAIEKIRGKMARKKSGGFSAKTLFVLSTLVLAVVITRDISRNGGKWENSETFKILQKYGINEYAQKASNRAMEGATWVHGKFQERFPGYTERAVEYSEPYLKLTKDLGKYLYNVGSEVKDLALEKYPLLIESIESYAPGLMEQSSKTVQNIWSTSLLYFNRSVDYLKQEVFVGQLAPENVQRLVIDALNTSQQKASEYYYWLYEKVQSTIK